MENLCTPLTILKSLLVIYNISMNIAIIGSGTMGCGIAISSILAKHTVSLFDVSEEKRTQAIEFISKELLKSVERGKLAPDLYEVTLSRCSTVSNLSEIAECDLIIEAIIEDFSIKQTLFKEIESVVTNPKTIIATNTSSFSISSLAKDLNAPERFVGLHFFNPAHIMKLVEIIKSTFTNDETISTTNEYVLSLGKTPALASDVPGFIVNRVARNYYNESLRLLTEGVSSIEQIDRILKGIGFKMGPFELMDLIGNDVNVQVSKSVWEQYFYEPRFTPSPLQQMYADAGLLGRKSGQGFYKYSKK
jgi:3-hydroxybutyryl-CoA dehydrogenase